MADESNEQFAMRMRLRRSQSKQDVFRREYLGEPMKPRLVYYRAQLPTREGTLSGILLVEDIPEVMGPHPKAQAIHDRLQATTTMKLGAFLRIVGRIENAEAALRPDLLEMLHQEYRERGFAYAFEAI